MYFFYYIPIGLDIDVRRRTSITYFIAVLSVTLFLLYNYRPAGPWWNLVNLAFFPSAPTVWSAMTYAFLHAGYLHIAGNVVYLVIFGRAVEGSFGPGRFFFIYMLSALIGAYTHVAFVRFMVPAYAHIPVAGASGATSGLLGAYMVRFYYSKIRVAYWTFFPLQGVNKAGKASVPVICAIFFWFVLQGVQVAVQTGGAGVRAAYSVHIGGFLAGMALALLFGAQSLARAERRLAKARNYFRQANWFASQGEYINYLAQRPDDAAAHAETARVYVCARETGNAASHYRKAIGIFIEKGDLGGAEGVFAEAMRAIPKFSLACETHLDLAYCMERTLKFSSAMRAYENFMERYRWSREAPLILLRMAGLLENRFKRPDGARECFERLVTEYPADVWVNFAQHELDRIERSGVRRED